MSCCTFIRIEGKKDKKAFRRFKKDLKRVLRQIKKDKGIKWASWNELLDQNVIEQICREYQYYKEDGFNMYLRLRVRNFGVNCLLYGLYNEPYELNEFYTKKAYYKVKGNVWGDCAYGKKN